MTELVFILLVMRFVWNAAKNGTKQGDSQMKSNLRIAWEIIEEWPASKLICQTYLSNLAWRIADALDNGKPKISLDAIGTDKCKVSVEGGLKWITTSPYAQAVLVHTRNYVFDTVNQYLQRIGLGNHGLTRHSISIRTGFIVLNTLRIRRRLREK